MGKIAIFYVPHQDDETLFMGNAILNHIFSGYDTHVVLLTNGAKSIVRNKLGITKEAFIQARNLEFLLALECLGVKKSNIHFCNLEDGLLEIDQVKNVIRQFENLFPNSAHKTMSWTDRHKDHRNAGLALRELYDCGEVKDARFYVRLDDHDKVKCIFETPEEKLQHYLPQLLCAIEVYKLNNAEKGHFGIGYQSVKELFDYLIKLPFSKYHKPFDNRTINERVSVITCTIRQEQMEQVFTNYDRQIYPQKELIIILNKDSMNIKAWKKKAKKYNNVHVYQLPETTTLGECLNYGVSRSGYELVAKFDDDDFYGPFYLTQAVHELKKHDVSIVGKGSSFMYFEEEKLLALYKPNLENQVSYFLKGGTFVFKKEIFNEVKFPHYKVGSDWLFLKELTKRGYKFYSTNRYHYVCIRRLEQLHTQQRRNSSYLEESEIISQTDDYIPFVVAEKYGQMDQKIDLSAKAKVTVVIMTYNRQKTIVKAIESVLKQTLSEWKLLILDDASTDSTMKIVKPYVLRDQRIMYYRLPENKGICHVMNEALNIVDTPYMVQLDSDDWLEDNALYCLVNSIVNAPSNVALTYGNHMVWKDSNRGILNKHRSFTTAEKYELLCYKTSIYPRCYKTKCLKEVGGWETNDKYNGRYMEDRRMLYKLIEKFDFLWIDEYMYNLNRYDEQRQTRPANRFKYSEVKKDFIEQYLKKWGNKYTAEFSIDKNGWLVTKLKANQ